MYTVIHLLLINFFFLIKEVLINVLGMKTMFAKCMQQVMLAEQDALLYVVSSVEFKSYYLFIVHIGNGKNGGKLTGRIFDSDLHDIGRFLNRILGLAPDIQNRQVFFLEQIYFVIFIPVQLIPY